MPKDTPRHSLPPAPELGTAKVVLSTGRSVTMRELTGRAQILADSCAGEGTIMALISYRAIGSIETIDDHKLAPVSSKAELDLITERLTGRELDEIVQAYSANFAARVADQKNESSTAA